MPNLKDALSRLLAIPGVRATVLVGRDGLPIDSAGRGDERFHDSVGAMGASALGTTEALGTRLAPVARLRCCWNMRTPLSAWTH